MSQDQQDDRSPIEGRRRQATAGPVVPFGEEAFGPSSGTTLRWLGMAGFLLNTRGTTIAIDPLLRDFDMPLLIDFPITTEAVPQLDAVLVTHSDNDHFSRPTCRHLAPVTDTFHSTHFVASEMEREGIVPAMGHTIGGSFRVGATTVTVTPADHAWQNEHPEPGQRHVDDDDACGFWLDTPDGSVWAPGDSRLIRDHHLAMPSPDALLFDFSDSEWHFTFDGAIEMANAYPDADLILHHWGSVDSPDFAPFNGDPADVLAAVDRPSRVRILAPGEPYELSRSSSARPVTDHTG